VSTLILGQSGEEIAAAFLRKKGYRVLARNVRTPSGEIDIVAREGRIVRFVEVRSRTGPEGTLRALESVDSRKQRRLVRLASWYLKEKRLQGCRVRFDVVAVVFGDAGPLVTLVRDAFETPGETTR
jgi:putative endonuclease